MPGNRKGANKDGQHDSMVTFNSAARRIVGDKPAQPRFAVRAGRVGRQPLYGEADGGSSIVRTSGRHRHLSARPPGTIRAAATAGSAPSAECWSPAPASARGSRHSWSVRPDQDRADETAADRTEAADDQNDEHQDGHAVADLAGDHGLILRPHHRRRCRRARCRP